MARLVLVTAATALIFGGFSHAAPGSSKRTVTIVLEGTAVADQTVGAGTFRGVRGLSDRGTFRVRRDLATRRDRWRLVGRRGTLVVSQIRNRWTIVSGTRAYVRLRGSGTSTVGESVTGFRAVWRGALTG